MPKVPRLPKGPKLPGFLWDSKPVICRLCGKEFQEYRSAEDKLLQAIFSGPLCKECKEMR